MKIGYNKIWGIVLLLLGVPACCLVAVSTQIGESVSPALVAAFWVCILLGVLFLAQTYVEIDPSHVFIKPLLGFRRRTFNVHSARDFSVEGKNVFVVSDGVRQKLPVSLWLVDRGNWASLLKWVETSNQQNAQSS